MRIRVTSNPEVPPSRCLWAELLARCAGRPVSFDCRIALLDRAGPPISRGQGDWFDRRRGPLTGWPMTCSSTWLAPALDEYPAPNLPARAAKDIGVTDGRRRLAQAHAGLQEGQRVEAWPIATSTAARAAGVDEAAPAARARAPVVEAACPRAGTVEFHRGSVAPRPAFVLERDIGDRAVFSGLHRAAPLLAGLEAMLEDTAAYASRAAHFGPPPTT